MKKVLLFALAALIVLHQDFWFWDRIDPLVFGFIPIGLAWHAGISIAAGALSGLAVRSCWPHALDAPDEAPTREGPG